MAIKKIIDVSSFNGKIDWGKVAENKPDLAIIRCGYGKNIKKQDDKQYVANIEGAIANGIPVSIYLYSYAIDEVGAQAEASHAIRLAEPYKDKIGRVFIACEEDGTEVTSADVTRIFCAILNGEGYSTGVRAPASWFKKFLKGVDPEDRWVVSWGENNGEKGEEPDVEYLYWQYTNVGSFGGVNTQVALSTSRGKSKKVKTYTEDKIEPEEAILEPVKETDPYEGTYTVTAEHGLNMRSGAGKDNASIAVLPFKTKVTYAGEHKAVGEQVWLKVKSEDGITGYCNVKFLNK